MKNPRPVKIWVQIILGLIPIAWIGALYNIGKLRLGLVTFISLAIGTAFLFQWLGFPPFTHLLVNVPVWVFLIRKWSLDWNKQFP